MLLGSAIILFFLDWRLALATLAVFPLMSVATAIFRRRSSRAYRRVRERLAAVTASLQEDISGMRVLQAFTREERNAAQFREVNEDYRAREPRDRRPERALLPLRRLPRPRRRRRSCSASAATSSSTARMTIGTLFAFIGYLANFFDPVQQLSQLYNTFLAAVAALDKIIDVMDEEPEVVDRPARARSRGSRARPVRGTSASATARGPEVLHGIDLDVPAGTTVALVGHTGAGKSTIAKLLARFYDPREGRSRSTATTSAT